MVGEVLDVMVGSASEGMTMMCDARNGFAKRVTTVIFMDVGRIPEGTYQDEFSAADARQPRTKDFLAKILQH